MKQIHALLMKTILCLMTLCCFVDSVNGQHLGDQLKRRLQGKTKLAEVMAIVDEMYSQLTDEQRNNGHDGLIKLKHWKRWEWYMARQLGPDGEIIDISKHNYELIKSISARDMGALRTPVQGEWTNLGPVQCTESTVYHVGAGIGRVDRIAFDPVDENIFYVGTPNGGLWKTYTAGQSWEPLLDTFPSLGISGITVSPSNPNEIFILTGVGDNILGNYYNATGAALPLGVFRSLNGGESWSPTNNFPIQAGTPYTSYDLEQSQLNDSILIAATSVGLFGTGDRGNTWVLLKEGYFFDVEFKPGSASVMYAASADAVYRSSDFGTTWTAAALNVPPVVTSNRIALAVTPADPSRVYAVFGNQPGQANLFAGVYLSTNEGLTFDRKDTTPNILGSEVTGADSFSQAIYDLCIAAHPVHPNRVVVGSANVWHSIHSGDFFSYLRGWNYNVDSLYIHVDQHAIAYNPLNNKLYMCNDGGIWVSANNGASVTNITEGLVLSEFYHLTQDYTTSYKVAGGTQDNGTFYRNNGSSDFVKPFGYDGFDAAFVAGKSNKIYSSFNNALNRINCNTGIATDISPDHSLGFKEIASHPTDSNIVFCAGINKIYKSVDQGATWTNTGGKGSWAIDISRANPSYMYAAGGTNWWLDGNGGAYRSTNGGNSWSLMSSNPGFPSLTNRLVTGISVHPTNSLHVTITVGGFTAGTKVFHSGNGGDSWINISYNLPNVAVLSIVTTPDGIFIGTGFSVYYIAHGQNNWIDIGSNIPHAMITDLNYDHNTGTLIASTYGRGVWQRDVCIEDITLTYPLTGELQYSCDDQLTSSSFIPGAAIDSINFRANGAIKLTPGFNVKTGAHLNARIEACDDGNIPLQGSQPETKSADALPTEGLSNRKGRGD